MIRNIPSLLLAALVVASVLSPNAADAAQQCVTPRQAVETLLNWQQPEQTDLSKAAACLDRSGVANSKEAQLRARQIKDVLDARGLFVELEDVPADAAYETAGGEKRFVLFRTLPELYIEKVGDQWLWSATAVGSAARLHSETFLVDVGSIEQNLPAWARQELFGLSLWQMIGLFVLILLGFLLRLLVSLLLSSWARRAMVKIGAHWGDEILSKGSRPIGTLTAAIASGSLLPLLRLPVRLSQVGMVVVQVIAALSVIATLYRLVDLFTAWLEGKAGKTETKLDDQLVPLIRKAMKVFVVAIGSVFVLQNLNVDVGGLLAGLGLGGLAFALAAKDTVANIFGSATIFADRPFHVGDWIGVAGVDGTVEQVGFRSTRLRTFHNSVVSIPNATIADSVIDNFGARKYRRVTTTLGLTYDTPAQKVQAFVEGIRAIILANEHTRKDFYEIHFKNFGPSSLDIMVYFFFEVATWSDELRERHNVMLEFLRLAEALGVSFAFPTQTLHVESLAPQKEIPTHASKQAPQLAEVVNAFGPGGTSSQATGIHITDGYFPGSHKG